MLLGQKLAVTANQSATKMAFRYLGKGMNFKEAYSYINRYSYFLQNEIMHNKKILVYMSNCPHIAYTFFALANTKNIAVPVDPNMPEPKIVDKIKELEIDAIIVSDDYVKRVQDMLRNNRLTLPIIQCEARRWGEYDTTYRLPTSVASNDNDVVAIFETSGSSGKPKMVPWTHTMIQQACLVLKSIYRPTSIDTFFTYNASLMNPFYFIHGLVFPLMSGCSVLITDLTAVEELAAELLESKASRILMKGSIIEEWLMSFKNLNLKMPLFRSFTPQPAPIPPRVEEFALSEYNSKILHVYGAVENCWAVAARQFEEPEPFDSVGQFLPGVKTRIIDENGDDIPGNKPQIGQLIISGPSVATTYFNDKDNTKVNMRGSWFFTGDYVEKDKKDVVRFLDRKDNMCKVVTHTVIPKRVEEKLNQCPGVDRAAILMTKDQMGKAQLTAVLVKKTGQEVSSTDINNFCSTNLAEHERPKMIAFMPELPLDAHGQINKYKLRFEFA
jgi:acyl-coenzyme A synthetase/AMP-(fatty) acid ligase